MTKLRSVDQIETTPLQPAGPSQHAPLDNNERQDLERCEATIARGKQSFLDVGQALAEIHAKQLFRETYKTFKDYCEQRWGFTRGHGYRLIEAAQVVAEVSPIGDTLRLANEGQARELAKVPRLARAEVMAKAAQLSPSGKPTSTAIRQARVALEKGESTTSPGQDSSALVKPAAETKTTTVQGSAPTLSVDVVLDPALTPHATLVEWAQRIYHTMNNAAKRQEALNLTFDLKERLKAWADWEATRRNRPE